MADLLPEVASALATASTCDEDAGARALALRYAELLDGAQPTREYAKSIRLVTNFLDGNLGESTADRQVADAWEKISCALAEHSVASDLGPKLLAALTAVGATLAGRKEQRPGGDGGKVMPMKSPLALARDEARVAREQRTGA